MHAQPAVAAPAPSIGKPVLPTSSATQAAASRAEAAEGRAGKASSPDLDMRGADEMHAQPAVAAPAPSVWKPVSPMSIAAQASASRAEVAEGRAGKARSPDLVMRKTNKMHAQPTVAAPAPSVGKPVLPTSSSAQASASRAEVAEGRVGKASSPDLVMRKTDKMHAPPVVAAPAPSVWKPVLPTSSAAQTSASRAEVAEGRAGKVRSLDLVMRKTDKMHA